jgi:hypothetical protein
MNELIKNIIKPENGLETAIIADPEFITGAMYGKPRRGHPEGAVIYHIGEVLANIDKYHRDDPDRADLRIIAIVHDTFKYKVNQNLPKQGDNHHGTIARKFSENFLDSEEQLTVIALHDDAYNAWQKGGRHGDWYRAKSRAEQLIKTLEMADCLDLYVKFMRCDGETGDKESDTFEWFTNLI